MNTGIELTLGGFLEGAAIDRSRNLTADIGSPWNTIPFPNSPNYHLSEFRFTARQTRLSLLAQGRVDADTALAGYVESDFLGAPTDANGVESNSYSPRLRHAYATLDRSDLGLHILGGQDWTFLTLFNHGLTPRQVPASPGCGSRKSVSSRISTARPPSACLWKVRRHRFSADRMRR